MTARETFQQFFKLETRKSGAAFILKNATVLSNKSDTYIQGYIKGGTSSKVSFSAESIESTSFTANCSCPQSKKGSFCKHIWAILLCVEENYPDFLTGKTTIEKNRIAETKLSSIKEKQSDYRKLQYQKQKLRAKELKIKKLKIESDSDKLPSFVETALFFFSENGFVFNRPLQEEEITNARKKLARVFHPDVGGSHEETVVLNKNFEILMRFLRP